MMKIYGEIIRSIHSTTSDIRVKIPGRFDSQFDSAIAIA